MADELTPRVLLAGVLSVLSDALEREETKHFSDDRFRADVESLRVRVESELDTLSGSRHLRLADGDMTSG